MRTLLHVILILLGTTILSVADTVMPLAKGFYPTQTIGITSDFSTDIASGDVDGDGDIDFAIANDGVQNRLYINNGDGTFTQHNISNDANKTRAIQLVDMDGDGDLDIITAEGASSGTVSSQLRFNNGHGQFNSYVNFETLHAPSYAKSIAAGDINGDGKNDVVIAYYKKNRICTQGTTPTSWSCSDLADESDDTNEIALADIDNDGRVDVIVGNSNNYNRIYFNNATLPMSRVDFDLSSGNTYSLAVGDLDKDGYLDIVIGNYGQTNRIYSFKGSRSPQSNSTMGTFEHNTYGISVGDIDKDGDLDIFVANNTQVNVLYTSQGNIFFNDTSASVLDDSRHSYKILMADIDSDGDYDLLCANGNLDSNTLIKAKSRRGFLAPIVSFLLSDSTPVTPPSAPSSITVTPVDKTSNQLQIRWHDNANNESSFVIYRSESSNVATKIQVGTSGANTTSFIDTTLNACTTYYYWVAAKNSAAESLSSSSEHGKTAPAAPVNLIASQGTVQKRIYLDWDVVSCAASYNVYEYNTTSSTWDMIGNVPNNLADTSLLDPSIIREYRVSSLDSSGNEGGLSYKFSGWGASDVPKNVQASKGQYTNGITLQWAPVQTCPNAQGVTARYINQFDLYGSNDNINFNKFDTYKIDTNLADGETSPSSDNPVSVWIPMSDTNHHYFMVTSVFKSDANCDGTYDNAVVYESNVADSVSTEGWAVAQQSETTSYPPAPTSINATDAQFCKIDISWASVSGASSYKLYRAQSSFGPWSYLTTTSATAFTQYANAQHDIYVWTGYWYKVSAIVNGVEGYVSQYDGGYATRAIGIVDCY